VYTYVCVCVCVCVYTTTPTLQNTRCAVCNGHGDEFVEQHLERLALLRKTCPCASHMCVCVCVCVCVRARIHTRVCVCVCVRARIHTHTRVCPSASRTAINIYPTPRTPHSQGIYPQTYSHNLLHPQSIPVKKKVFFFKKIVFFFGAIYLRFNGAVHLNNGACTHGIPCSLLTSLMCCWSEALSHSMLLSPQSTTSISAGLKICSHHPNHIDIHQGFVKKAFV